MGFRSCDEHDKCISEKLARGLYIGGNARERKAVEVTAPFVEADTGLWNAHVDFREVARVSRVVKGT